MMDATEFRLAQLEIAVNVLASVIANDRAVIGQLVQANANTTDAMGITAVTMKNVMDLIATIVEKRNG